MGGEDLDPWNTLTPTSRRLPLVQKQCTHAAEQRALHEHHPFFPQLWITYCAQGRAQDFNNGYSNSIICYPKKKSKIIEFSDYLLFGRLFILLLTYMLLFSKRRILEVIRREVFIFY
jgi:hypothetical protein